MKYIKSNITTGETETINVPNMSKTNVDISKDTDDIRYTFDTFEDYMQFATHIDNT